MFENSRLSVYIFDDTIIIKNQNQMQKQFPRCGITKVELFILEMAKRGKLDDLLY